MSLKAMLDTAEAVDTGTAMTNFFGVATLAAILCTVVLVLVDDVADAIAIGLVTVALAGLTAASAVVELVLLGVVNTLKNHS